MERVGKRRRESKPRSSPPNPLQTSPTQQSISPQSTSSTTTSRSARDLYDVHPILPPSYQKSQSHRLTSSSPANITSHLPSSTSAMPRPRKRKASEAESTIMPPQKKNTAKVKASRKTSSDATQLTNGDDITTASSDAAVSTTNGASRAQPRASRRTKTKSVSQTEAPARSTRSSRSKAKADENSKSSATPSLNSASTQEDDISDDAAAAAQVRDEALGSASTSFQPQIKEHFSGSLATDLHPDTMKTDSNNTNGGGEVDSATTKSCTPDAVSMTSETHNGLDPGDDDGSPSINGSENPGIVDTEQDALYETYLESIKDAPSTVEAQAARIDGHANMESSPILDRPSPTGTATPLPTGHSQSLHLSRPAGKLKRGRPGRPKKGAATRNDSAKPSIKPVGTVKGRGAPGKRKIARHWKLQAYYDRQAHLRATWKNLSKIIYAATAMINEEALKRITEDDPLHYQHQPEYQQVMSELDSKLAKKQLSLNNELESREKLKAGLLQRQKAYEDHVLKCRVQELKENACTEAQVALVNIFKNHYPRSEQDIPNNFIEDEWSVLREEPPITKFSADERAEAIANSSTNASKAATPAIDVQESDQIADTTHVTRSKNKGGRPPKNGRSPHKGVKRYTSAIDSHQDLEPAGSIVDDLTSGSSLRVQVLGSSLRSVTSTPVPVADDSAAATPEPQNVGGLPAPGELLFPDKPTWRTHKSAHNNRIVGLSFWDPFDEDEIGLRSLGHEGKGPQPEKAIDLRQWMKEVRLSPNQPAVYFDNSSGPAGKIENYQPGELDPVLVELFGVHARYGIPVPGCRNPDQTSAEEGSEAQKLLMPTDFSKPLAPTKPITFLASNGERLPTSRSVKHIYIDKIFNELSSHARVINALDGIGALEIPPAPAATYASLLQGVHPSRLGVDELLAASELLEKDPDAARKAETDIVENKDKKIDKPPASDEAATVQPVRRSKRVRHEPEPRTATPSSKRQKTADKESREKKSKRQSQTVDIQYPSGSGNYVHVLATGAAATAGSDSFPPLDPTTKGHPSAIFALADMAEQHGADRGAFMHFSHQEAVRPSPEPAQRPARRYHSFPSAWSQQSQDHFQPHQIQQQPMQQSMQMAPPPQVMHPQYQPSPPHHMLHHQHQHQHQHGPPQPMQPPLHQPQQYQPQFMGHPPPMNHHMPPPPSPYGPPSPYSQHHPSPSMMHSMPPPPPRQQHLPPPMQSGPPPSPSIPANQHAQRTMAPPSGRGSGLRDIRPRPEAHYYENAAIMPMPYNPNLPPGPPPYQSRYPPYTRGGRM